ncbi:hypothetical protein PALB_10780 [Pseudoalteromonas luteoviolacea B = ATCC 29581]|nr:hypothetical protein PALB_10780 [Pseudoalteromonas luteoviolacea B = ATCC 29581]
MRVINVKDIEKRLAESLGASDLKSTSRDHEIHEQQLIKRAVSTGNKRTGMNDLAVLGISSIWIVFANLFVHICKPFFNKTNTQKIGKKL